MSRRVDRAGVAGFGDACGADSFDDDTELFLGPTARPLPRGTGYFSDHWVFFPGAAYGLTDNVTLAGGASFLPGVGINDQVLFFTPKIGTRLGSHAAIAAGGLFARGGGVRLAVPYAITTVGSSAASLTAGVAFGRATGSGQSHASSGPILLVGGSARISRHFDLLTENWIFPKEDFQLFSGGVRIHGGRLSVDLGVVFNPYIIDQGVPVPWLSFAYHFGSRRPEH